jgi:adenylosuccinate synthase
MILIYLLGAKSIMQDIDFGSYPNDSIGGWHTTVGSVCSSLGAPPTAVETCIGVVKAYSTKEIADPLPGYPETSFITKLDSNFLV